MPRPTAARAAPPTPDSRASRFDPGVVAAALAPLLVLALLRGGRPGVPVADDFDFLQHVLFSDGSWLDGGGSRLYWRPLARQGWYTLLAPWMLDHPWLVAAIQTGCLGVIGVALYRAFRPALGRATALAISTAPWLMESSRMLIAWPSCFQDLGALLFLSLALHEATRGRRATFLASGLLALLCKEVAAIALITILWCPIVSFEGRRRRSWLAATLVLVGIWGVVSAWVYARATIAVAPPGWSGAGGVMRAAAIVAWWSFKAIWSLPPATRTADLAILLGLVAITPWPRIAAALRSGDRDLSAWWRWGLAWTLPMALTLVPLHPAWGPYRFPLVGFGVIVALTVTLAAAHRRALAVFVLLRLVLLVAAPAPARRVAGEPPNLGASIDVPRLTRLEHLVADTRDALRKHFPRMPRGAAVAREGFPNLAEYAFGERSPLHVWYRDTTLRWIPIRDWNADPALPVITVVEYQEGRVPAVALVEPDAMRAMISATHTTEEGRWAESLTWLARADSLQRDTTAATFRRTVAGKRAYATARWRLEQGRVEEAREQARALLALFPRDVPGRQLLAEVEERLARTRGR